MRKLLVVLLAAVSFSIVGYSAQQSSEGSDHRLTVVVETIPPAPVEAGGAWSMDPLRRVLACQRLGESDDPRSVYELLRLASDENPMVRAHAVYALGSKPTSESLKLLIRTLHSGDWRARRCAVESLLAQHSREAVEALRFAMEDESEWVRLEAARAVKRLELIHGD